MPKICPRHAQDMTTRKTVLTKRLPDKMSKTVLTKRLPDKTSKAVLTKRLPDKTSKLVHLKKMSHQMVLTKRLPDKMSKLVLTKCPPDKTSKAVLTKCLPDKMSADRMWHLYDMISKTMANSSAHHDTFVLGKHNWTIQNDQKQCHDVKGQIGVGEYNIGLKLSGCEQGLKSDEDIGEFTCDNGQCVSMRKRCDQFPEEGCYILNCMKG